MDAALDLSSIELDEHKIITCEIEGIVDEDDLRAMALGEPTERDANVSEVAKVIEVDDPTDMGKLREKWHSVARHIAKGTSQRLTAALTGYTESYLSILLRQPAMMELVTLYRIQNGAAAEVATEKLRTVGLKALEKLEEKIDEGKLNHNELIQASKLGLDRSGLGPSSTHHQVNENHTIDHAKIAEQTRLARQGSREFIVPVKQVRDALTHQPQTAEESEADAAG